MTAIVEQPAIPYAPSNFTDFENYLNMALGVCFLGCAVVAGRRLMLQTTPQTDFAVISAFYTLILATSILRAIWFLIPSHFWRPSYTPSAVYAWDSDHPSWVGMALSEIVVTAGSLALFAIFILILVYWADILKKYFDPGSRRRLPMTTFMVLVSSLAGIMILVVLLFLAKVYTTEGMILFHALLLAAVSLVCVGEITIFSQRFRTVLKTLGAINQVSTDTQIKRIVWITITGNLFFGTRAALELVFSGTVAWYWHENGTVARTFTHAWWDTYTILKYASEVTILALMLYILQSRFQSQQQQYQAVPNADTPAVVV